MPTSHRTTTRRPPRPEPSSAVRQPAHPHRTMPPAAIASEQQPRPPRARTKPRPTTAPTHPPGGAGECRCRARDRWPVLMCDFTVGDQPRAELLHDPGRCGLPATPHTLRSAT